MNYTAQEELRKRQWRAIEMLAGHDLLAENYWDEGRGARWILGTSGTFTARCEIIAGIGGSLIVHGDFEVVRFGHYSDHQDAFNRLCWMGLCRDVDYYVAQKATIGMGRGRDSIRDYDEDLAIAQIKDFIKDYEHECRPAAAAVLTEALEYTENEQTLREFLYQRGSQWELWDHSFGEVLDYQVVIAHVALNRTACLLMERHGPAGPPACLPKDRTTSASNLRPPLAPESPRELMAAEIRRVFLRSPSA